ncbi:MAG: hypothetical protein NXI01_03230 [Gammaproteobacteria bacterium]|nr:hypothetical protein [Gammaproteobacteria bacterium]
MKKYILSVLLCLPALTAACDTCNCKRLLNITIENKTDAVCYLTQQEITEGIEYSKSLPLKILAGETTIPYSIEEYNNINQSNVTFSFQCGDDKFATIRSKRTVDRGYFSDTETIAGLAPSLSNMDTTYVSTLSNCKKSKPATIHWTLQ